MCPLHGYGAPEPIPGNSLWWIAGYPNAQPVIQYRQHYANQPSKYLSIFEEKQGEHANSMQTDRRHDSNPHPKVSRQQC